MHLGERSNYLFTMVSTQSGQRPSGVGWEVVLVRSFKKFYDVSTFRDQRKRNGDIGPQKAFSRMRIAASLGLVPNRRQLERLPTGAWIRTLGYVHTRDSCSIVKGNKRHEKYRLDDSIFLTFNGQQD